MVILAGPVHISFGILYTVHSYVPQSKSKLTKFITYIAAKVTYKSNCCNWNTKMIRLAAVLVIAVAM